MIRLSRLSLREVAVCAKLILSFVKKLGRCCMRSRDDNQPRNRRDNLERSLAFSGTNRRLRRVLAKFRRGETVNVGAIGGSGERAFHLHKSIIERLSSYKRLRIKSLR